VPTDTAALLPLADACERAGVADDEALRKWARNFREDCALAKKFLAKWHEQPDEAKLAFYAGVAAGMAKFLAPMLRDVPVNRAHHATAADDGEIACGST
jgi:3-deoxy-D-arabino-heptulosonate 7-phosphate (DAHP) synthase class II